MSGAGRRPLAETEDQAALRRLARDVATREVAPRASEDDETGEVPTQGARPWPLPISSASPSESSGAAWGLGDVEASIVLEEIARADVSRRSAASWPSTGRPGGSSIWARRH